MGDADHVLRGDGIPALIYRVIASRATDDGHGHDVIVVTTDGGCHWS